MADAAQQKETMVNALREEPGSYTRILEDGTEVIYTIHPLNGGFIAGWEYATGSESHEEEFRTHADALRHLEKNFDAPLGHREER
jgi:hypothetical protein